MRADRGRALLLDAGLALAVGVLSWGAAQVGSLAGQFDDGPRRRGGPAGPTGGDFDWPLATQFSWPLYPSLALVVAALAVRRIWPRAAFLLVVAGVAGYLAAGGPSGPVLLAPALALLALTLHATALHSTAQGLPLRRWAPLTLLLVPMLVARSWKEPYLGLLQPSFYPALVSGTTR